MENYCYYCGHYGQVDGAHVKNKTEFTEDDRNNKVDREKNIINLCKEHHSLFDYKKNLGLVRFSDDYYYFTRWRCCNEGICASKSKIDIINLFLLGNYRKMKGDEGKASKIKIEYIKWKNERLSDIEHISFTREPSESVSKCSKIS